jgi:hypothetical protein
MSSIGDGACRIMRKTRRNRFRNILRRQRIQVLASWMTFLAIWTIAGMMLLWGMSAIVEQMLQVMVVAQFTP